MKLRLGDRTVLTFLGVMILGTVMNMHSASEKKYELSELQHLRLEVKQKDAQIAQQNYAIAQSQFQKSIADFNAEAKKIEQENGWPETLKINIDNLTFTEMPPVPPVPEKK